MKATTWRTLRRVMIALVSIESLLLVLIVAGIAVGHAMEPSTATPPTPPSLARGVCAPDDARAHIEAFMAAFNANDAVAINRTLSPVLVWFFETVAEGQTRTAYGHDAAAREVAGHAGESMALANLQVSAEPSFDGATGFGAEVRRTVGGVSFRQIGKGELRCGGEWDGIVVWSMGLAPAR
jgi:hypothetical protein